MAWPFDSKNFLNESRISLAVIILLLNVSCGVGVCPGGPVSPDKEVFPVIPVFPKFPGQNYCFFSRIGNIIVKM